MKLLYISGFPRSGTSYLHRWLKACMNCYGVKEEQGLDVVWKAMKQFGRGDYDQVSSSLWSLTTLNKSLTDEEIYRIKETHWMGIFVWKNMKVLGPTFLDGWCWAALKRTPLVKRLVIKNYIVKTPIFVLSPKWPEEYVQQSRLFDDYRVVVLARNPEEVYHSGHNKFPFWKDDGVTKEKLYSLWVDLYRTAQNKSDKWIIE